MNQDEKVKKGGPERLSVWMCISLFMVGFLLFMGLYSVVGVGALSLMIGEEIKKPGMVSYVVMETCMLLAVLTPALILLRFERRSFSDLGLTVRGHAKELLWGTLTAVLLYLIGFGWSWGLGEVEVTGMHLDPLSLTESWFFFLLVALTEEIMVRGYVLGRLLHTQMNKFLSLLLSAVLFGLLHIFNPNVAFLPMLNLVLAGILLGSVYLYTRNLCFPIALHLFWNWIQGPVLGYPVSGNHFGTSFLTLRISDESTMSGGAFGFEGSIICTVLMGVFTLAIIWWGEKREAIRNL